MKYFVLNRGDEHSIQLTETFHALAAKHRMTIDEQSPDIVISIGGDGTMLHAFQMFKDQLERVSFVGIHTGRLGFYADWKPEEIEELVQLMSNEANINRVEDNMDNVDVNMGIDEASMNHFEHNIAHYPTIELHVTTENESFSYLALNEFTVKGMIGTLVAHIHINDVLFETFRGDGMLISSPSGSTAYNKSLGGALIHPSLEAMQVTEIASINNRVYRTLGSPIILPRHHYCDIIPKQEQRILLSIDHLHVEHEAIKSIRCQVSEQKVRFARYRPFPFWSRVKGAFISNE